MSTCPDLLRELLTMFVDVHKRQRFVEGSTGFRYTTVTVARCAMRSGLFVPLITYVGNRSPSRIAVRIFSVSWAMRSSSSIMRAGSGAIFWVVR